MMVLQRVWEPVLGTRYSIKKTSFVTIFYVEGIDVFWSIVARDTRYNSVMF